MRVFVIYIALMICAAGLPAETIHLDRSKVTALALQQNESYKSALLEKDRVSGQYIEARAGAFPRLTFNGSYLYNIDLQTSIFTVTDSAGRSSTTQIRFGSPNNYSVGLSLYQPLYVAGKVGAALKIAGYGKKYTQASIDAARHNIMTEADKAYLDAVAAKQSESIFREAEDLADSNLAVVKKLYDQGQASEYDMLRAQVQAANTRPNRIAAENNTRLALDYLRNVLALPPETEITLDTVIEQIDVPKLNLDSLVTEALNNRPELQQSEQMVNIRDKMVSIAYGGYKPTLGINSQVQWYSYTDKFSKVSLSDKTWFRSWNVSLNLTWPIFTGFETTGQVRQAKVDYQQSKLSESQLNRQIRLEVRDALGRVNEAKERVDALGETVDQAQRGLEIAQVRFENGVGIQLELLDAQVALTTARVNRIAALHDLAAAVSNLRKAVGREWAPQW